MKRVIRAINGYCLIIVMLSGGVIEAQTFMGGTHIYGFLSQSSSARQTALGNAAISYDFRNSSVMFANPALLSEKHNYSASVQHQFQFAGAGNGSVSYAQSLGDSTWTMGLGVTYIDYGTFQGYDEYEIYRGEFSALDVSIQGTAAKQLGPRLHLGTSVKFISSAYEQYNSVGLGVDIGAYYYIKESHLGLSFLMKDLAFQLSSYSEGESGIPVDFQVGMSKRMEHLPLRFQLTYHHLNKWRLLDSEDAGPGSDLNQSKKSKLDILANDFMSHLVISTELGIGKNQPVYLRLSYNHFTGQVLSVGYYRAFTGIGLGIGFDIRGVKFDYGYAISHLAGGKHAIGLAYTFGRKPHKTKLRE